MLLDEFLPDYDVADRHRVTINAPAGAVYEVVRALDVGGSWKIRLLFFLRGLPARVARRRSGKGPGLTLDALLRAGFVLLRERPDREFLLGVVGRFWALAGDVRRLDADEFRGFQSPGYAKAGWNFHLSEKVSGTTLLVTETRVLCLDEASAKRFRPYWSLVGSFSGLIRAEILQSIKRGAERPAARSGPG